MKQNILWLWLGAIVALSHGFAASPKIYRDKIDPHWFDGGNRFWYGLELPREERQFVLVDVRTRERAPAFDHQKAAEALSQSLSQHVLPEKLPIDALKFSDDGKSVYLIGKEATWLCPLDTYQLTKVDPIDPGESRSEGDRESRRSRRESRSPRPAGKSPDGKWEIVARGHNLFRRDLSSEKEEQLTYDANPDSTYLRDTQRERSMGMRYDAPEATEPEVYWAPDSKRFVAMRTRPGTQRTVYLINSSPKDQVQPKLESYPYLKPGDEIPITKPRLFEVETKREVPIDEALFLNPWSITELRWATNGHRFTFLYNQRGHQCLRIVSVEAATGTARTLLEEKSETFVDYANKSYLEHLEATREVLWMSERDGWNHLYLFDSKRGELKNQVTRGEWVVRGVDRVDPEARRVWFRASGLRAGEDPYYIHYCRVNFDGTDLRILTEGDGTHLVQHSPDRRFLIDTWSRVDLPPISVLRFAETGELVCELEKADDSELRASGGRPPERFAAKGRDGQTDIYGIIIKPKDFDPAKKYPVIEQIYAGPHGSFVPKNFRASYSGQSLADRGFIVVQIDGMGTSNRSKKFHDVCWKNIGDAGFPDRILWMKAAAVKHPSMDLSRVGIYGGSAGGQNALRALLAHGDFYQAAAADCGCHDNRMDKIWWNELWMSWPVGPHYDEQSNVTQAHKLKGKLLLTVGELDRNVDPASTMQVANALIKANKDFELIVFPGAGHGAGGSPYGERRRAEFFMRHLQNRDSGSASVEESISP